MDATKYHVHTDEALALLAEAKRLLAVADDAIAQYDNLVVHSLFELGYDLPFISGYETISGGVKSLDNASALDGLFHRNYIPPEERRRRRLAKLTHAERLVELGNEFYWTCVYCQRSGSTEKGPDGRSWHVDHGYPRALGGQDDWDNYILSCATCNMRKGKQTAMAVLRRTFDNMGAK